MPKKAARKVRKVKAKPKGQKAKLKGLKSPSAKKARTPESKRGFMWKVLEMKEAQRKSGVSNPAINPDLREQGRVRPQERHLSLLKFAGPKRRAG